MNIALLDPFQRQIPDRIDSTLTLPKCFHPVRHLVQNNEVGISEIVEDKPKSSSIGSGNVERSTSTVTEDETSEGLDERSTSQGRQSKSTQSTSTSPRKSNDKAAIEHSNWHSSYIVSFNHNGSYIAVGHASGCLPIYDFASRTLSCIHYPTFYCTDDDIVDDMTKRNDHSMLNDECNRKTASKQPKLRQHELYKNGITAVSWSSSSRFIMVSSYGDPKICLHDNTHPFGPRDVCYGISYDTTFDGNTLPGTKNSGKRNSTNSPDIFTGTGFVASNAKNHSGEADEDDATSVASQEVSIPSTHPPKSSSIKNVKGPKKSASEALYAPTYFINDIEILSEGKASISESEVESPLLPSFRKRPSHSTSYDAHNKRFRREPFHDGMEENVAGIDSPHIRYQSVALKLPRPITGSQIHPNNSGSGLACLDDGSLVMFTIPTAGKKVRDSSSSIRDIVDSQLLFNSNERAIGKMVYLSDPSSTLSRDGNQYFITCATFSKSGDAVYAATKCGSLIGILISGITTMQSKPCTFTSAIEFRIKIGNTKPYQILLSRNGKKILINSSDNVLRLYNIDECWQACAAHEHANDGPMLKIDPCVSFQDAVSRIPWITFDFSANDEYVVGGCNHNGDKYELYVWDTTTGLLIDQLTGPQVSINSLSIHPTRRFIAVATDDGLVDIWGPKLDWTAFAPDFQALRKNVEYIEKEDEFDHVVDGDRLDQLKRQEIYDELEEKEVVDVLNFDTIHTSQTEGDDTEEPIESFYFETSIRGMMGCLRSKGKV